MINVHQETIHKRLVIDTSTAVMTIALMAGDELLAESSERVERKHSNKLVPAIQALIHSLGMTMKDVDGVAVGVGPGSYTGVRIGVTLAKTLAWSLNIPLFGVSSLEALAYSAVRQKLHCQAETKQWIVPLMDARRGQVYTSLHESESGQLQCHKKDQILLLEDWVEQIMDTAKKTGSDQMPIRLIFVGEVAQVRPYIEELQATWNGSIHTEEYDMNAFDLGLL